MAIGFVFATARRLAGSYAATLVTLAMAVARTQLYLALAVRGYEMLLALGAIALWLMVRIDVSGPTRRRMIGLVLMTFVLLLTHYFAFGAAVAIGVFGLWRGRRHRVAFVVSLVVLAGIYAIIWLPFALRQLDYVYTGDALVKLDSIDIAALAILLLATPMRLLTDALATESLAAAISGLLLLAVAVAWTMAPERSRRILPAVLWLVCTISFIGAFDVIRITRHAQSIRYLAIASPAVFVVAAVGAVAGRAMAIIAGALLLAFAIVVRPPGPQVLADGPDYSKTASWLAKHIQPGDALLVVHRAGRFQFGDMLLLHCSHEPGLFPRPTVKVDQPLSAALIAQLPRRAWIINAYADASVMSRNFPTVRVLERYPIAEDAPGEICLVELRGNTP